MLLLLTLLLLFAVAVGAGFLGSLAGLGGGIIMGPVLVIALHVPFPYAVGASAVSVLGTSMATGAMHAKDRLTDFRIGMFLQTATVPGAMLGAGLTVYLSTQGFSSALLVVLGLVLLLTVPGALARLNEELPPSVVPDRLSRRFHLRGSYRDQRLGREVDYEVADASPALGLMFGAGVLSGLFGIGSGVLNVLAMERQMRLPMKIATATSNLMIGITVAAGTGILLLAGYISPLLAVTVAAGTTSGALVGSLILPRLSNRGIRFLFLPVLIVLGAELVLRGVGLG